jgi:hypothetical protein
MMARLKAVVFIGALVVAALSARDAWACAMCGCGDPTLTTMGAEQPFAGRLRLSSELRYRSDAIGDAPERTQIEEVRACPPESPGRRDATGRSPPACRSWRGGSTSRPCTAPSSTSARPS